MHELSIAEVGTKLRSGELTSEALTRHALSRIDQHDPQVRAFVCLTRDLAIAQARSADDELRRGKVRGAMHGVPYALKDLFNVAGVPTTCNSRLREGFVPTTDSAVFERMSESGAVLLGKVHMQEFATGGTGPDLPYPPPRNPWNREHITGGSSSGAAAAVAAGFVRLAIGSDTGGSIRQPAAYCGIVGLKPTYGRVSPRGAFPLSFSLDHCGPMARSVEDAAIALEVLTDDTGIDRPANDCRGALSAGVAGLRIGIPAGHMGLESSFDPEVAGSMEATTEALRRAGAHISAIALPDYDAFFASNTAIMLAEAFALHQHDLRTKLSSYAENTAHRLLLGAAVSGPDLVQAFRLRRSLTEQLDSLFNTHDVILTASAISGAPHLQRANDFFSTPMQIPALPFNLTGHPAIHVPTTMDGLGLPVGLQLIASRHAEAVLLRCAFFIEQESGWGEQDLPELDRTLESVGHSS
nr:amidase [Chelatococcus asaccharovorans]